MLKQNKINLGHQKTTPKNCFQIPNRLLKSELQAIFVFFSDRRISCYVI